MALFSRSVSDPRGILVWDEELAMATKTRGAQLDFLHTAECQRAAKRVRTSGLKIVGLFAGIGGIELGLQKSGHEAALLCEIDPAARAVLSDRFPDVALHEDIRTLTQLPKGTQLLAGGFPCQDLSQAGKTAGIEGSRSGLVGEVFRLLRRERVPWLLLENVPFMLRLAKGKALTVIVDALEALGYRWAYRVVDTRAFGLPQRRERVFLIASLDGDPREVLLTDDAGEPPAIAREGRACGFYWTEGIKGLGWAVDAVPTLKGGSTVGIPSPPAIWMPDGRIVKPDIRDAERMQGFDADWTKPAETVTRKGGRWKLVGNAVTVDVVAWIGSRLLEPQPFSDAGAAPLSPGSPWPRAAWNMGHGRFASSVSSWPVRRRTQHLDSFLRHPVELLSVKATAGFFGRTKTSSLRFPEGFLEAVGAHLRRMTEASAA